MKKIENGLFVVIEGPDGAGKTTAANNLVKALKEKDYNAIYVREPGGIKAAEDIRNIVLHNELSDREALLLFTASMSLNMRKTILPELKNGSIVICDRFIRSTWVYQGFANFENPYTDLDIFNNIFRQIVNYAIYDKHPNIEFVLDISPEAAWKRTHVRDKEEDVFESKGYEFFKTINEGYLYNDYFLGYPVRINAELSEEVIVDKMLKYIIDIIEYIEGTNNDVSTTTESATNS